MLKNDPAPVPGFRYVNFRGVSVGDAAGPRVAFTGRMVGVGGRHGIFLEDPDGGPGVALALEDDLGPTGQLFLRFERPSIDGAGHVAWFAHLSAGRRGIFRDGPTTVSVLGDPVPGVAGLLHELSVPVMVDPGLVVFSATLSGGAVVGGVTIDQVILRCGGGDGNCSSGSGTLDVLVSKNDPVPDRPGRRLCDLREVAASSWGIVFRASTRLDCAGVDPPVGGVFRQRFGGALETVALAGEAAEPFPAPGGTVYASFVDEALGIENDGIVVFQASTTQLVGTRAQYVCDPGSCPAAPAVAAVALGDAAPGGGVFRRFSAPAVTDAGDLVFSAVASGAPGLVRALYVRHPDDAIDVLALEGAAVPGSVPPATVRRYGEPSVSPDGRVVFRAIIRNVTPPRNARRGMFVIE